MYRLLYKHEANDKICTKIKLTYYTLTHFASPIAFRSVKGNANFHFFNKYGRRVENENKKCNDERKHWCTCVSTAMDWISSKISSKNCDIYIYLLCVEKDQKVTERSTF